MYCSSGRKKLQLYSGHAPSFSLFCILSMSSSLSRTCECSSSRGILINFLMTKQRTYLAMRSYLLVLLLTKQHTHSRPRAIPATPIPKARRTNADCMSLNPVTVPPLPMMSSLTSPQRGLSGDHCCFQCVIRPVSKIRLILGTVEMKTISIKLIVILSLTGTRQTDLLYPPLLCVFVGGCVWGVWFCFVFS